MSESRHLHALALLGYLQSDVAKAVAFEFHDSGRIDASAVHHYGKGAVIVLPDAAHDGDGLSCLHTVAHLNEVLRIVTIDSLQTVVMAYDDDVSLFGMLVRQTHHTGKHRLHGIALLGGNLHLGVILHYESLAHRQREGIIVGRKLREVYLEGIAAVEQSRSGNADLLLFGGSKLMILCPHGICKGKCYEQAGESQIGCRQS